MFKETSILLRGYDQISAVEFGESAKRKNPERLSGSHQPLVTGAHWPLPS